MSVLNNLTSLPTFDTKRLILRQITNSVKDNKECLEFINDYQVYKTWGMYDENSRKMSKPELVTSLTQHYEETIADFNRKDELTWLIIDKEQDRVIGEILLYDFLHDYQAEMGYRIRHDEWGKGYASEAGQAIISFAFEVLGLTRLQLKCFATNIGSRRVAEKLGFVEEGFIHQGVILEVITDFYIYGLLKENYEKREDNKHG